MPVLKLSWAGQDPFNSFNFTHQVETQSSKVLWPLDYAASYTGFHEGTYFPHLYNYYLFPMIISLGVKQCLFSFMPYTELY